VSEAAIWILKAELIERTIELFHRIDRGEQPLGAYFADEVDWCLSFAKPVVRKTRDEITAELQAEYQRELPKMRHDLGCFRAAVEGDHVRVYATGFRYTFTTVVNDRAEQEYRVKAAAADTECVWRVSDKRITGFLFDMSAVYVDT